MKSGRRTENGGGYRVTSRAQSFDALHKASAERGWLGAFDPFEGFKPCKSGRFANAQIPLRGMCRVNGAREYKHTRAIERHGFVWFGPKESKAASLEKPQPELRYCRSAGSTAPKALGWTLFLSNCCIPAAGTSEHGAKAKGAPGMDSGAAKSQSIGAYGTASAPLVAATHTCTCCALPLCKTELIDCSAIPGVIRSRIMASTEDSTLKNTTDTNLNAPTNLIAPDRASRCRIALLFRVPSAPGGSAVFQEALPLPPPLRETTSVPRSASTATCNQRERDQAVCP